jgi:hypothetical protein
LREPIHDQTGAGRSVEATAFHCDDVSLC